MDAAPTLTTDRLLIRPIAVGDFEAYAAMWADPRVTTFIGGAPRPRDVCWVKFCQAAGLWPLLGYGYWSIADRSDGRYLGTGGFARMERGLAKLGDHPEAGWAFAADAWGRGIASEAVAAFVDWADAALPTPETRCMVDHGNAASVKVAERNGYLPIANLEGSRIFSRRKQAA